MSSNNLKRLILRHCKGRSSLIKLVINFAIIALVLLFLISQLYKSSSSSSTNSSDEGEKSEVKQDVDQPIANQLVQKKAKASTEKRPIVLPLISEDEFNYVEPYDSFFKQKHNVLRKRKDWHDYEHIQQEKARRGPGEQGKAFKLTDPQDIEINTQLLKVNGYYARASDIISVNRSVADIRHPLCQQKKYLLELPTASVIIPFFNDHLSVLMRTVHSCINRAPAHLLKEVILVNDHSTKTELYDELKAYLANNFDGKAHVIDLPARSGLITARLAGARAAKGDVLIFLDSHTEANTNWLPPLLDPIASDYRTCVCPFIDVIDAQDYEYRAQDEGNRGAFEWNFLYKRIDIRPGDQETPADNFPSPIMAGGLFAMSAKFFWEVGGYDPGLDIWGGEQYELSFKIWLCGGEMVDSPCSRIGHIYKSNPFPDPRGYDYVSKNFKRVAEVWMDEYKEFIYERKPDRFARVDTGDISKQLAIKEKNKCKPFKYFLEVVAPDMLEKYPPTQIEFAKGAIESVALKDYCIDSMGHFYRELGLYRCSHNKQRPSGHQHYFLGHHRDIEFYSDAAYCIDSYGSTVRLGACHHKQGGQYFRYDLDTQQMYSQPSERKCLEADPTSQKILIKSCDSNEIKQKWKWGHVNEDNLRHWNERGAKILK